MLFDAMIMGVFKPIVTVHTTGSYTAYISATRAVWGRCKDNRYLASAMQKPDLDTITALLSVSYDLRRRKTHAIV